MTDSNKKRGRPSKFKEEYCDMLIEHMKKGMSFESFAAVINVNRDTLFEWRRVEPNFSDAYKKALEVSLYTWEQLGHAGMMGKVAGFNPTLWIFNMKNRFKWRDKQPEEVTQVNVNIEKMSDEELEKIIKEAAEKLK